jgi:hypothetical protein
VQTFTAFLSFSDPATAAGATSYAQEVAAAD